MIKNAKTKYLWIALVVLLILAVAGRLSESKRGDRSFDSQLTKIEVDEITSIELTPKAMAGQTITFDRVADDWTATLNGQTFKVRKQALSQIIDKTKNLVANGLAGTSKEKWQQFELTDSLASHVIFYAGKKKKADVYIGGIQYIPPQTMNSYVRLAGADKTYTVDGFLSMIYNRQLNDFRNQTITPDISANCTKIELDYQNGEKHLLNKTGDKWMLDNGVTDSTTIAEYVKGISGLSSQKLTDMKAPVGSKVWELTIDGNNFDAPIKIECFDNNGEKLICSSVNSETVFNDQKIAEKLELK